MKKEKSLKIIISLAAICFFSIACVRPMLQPPATASKSQKDTLTTQTASNITRPESTISVEQPTTSLGLAETPTPGGAATSTYGTHPSTVNPTPSLFPTLPWCPAELPATEIPGKIRIAYNSNGNLWLWGESVAAIQLTKTGDTDLVSISGDGQWIAYTRKLDEHHAELWAIRADGSDPKRLVNTDELVKLDGSTNVLGVLPVMLQWQPGSHYLAFYTYPLYDALWIYQPSIPWLVDVDSGKVSAASFPAGNISYSPDGKYVTIFSKSALSLAKIDGSDLKENILPDYHAIGEGESYYYPRPVWAPDSSALQLALPDQNDLYNPSATVSVWQIPLNAKPGKLGQWIAFAPSVHFSPDLSMMAYWSWTGGSANVRELHLAYIGDPAAGKPEDVVYFKGNLTSSLSWSPDSQHFIFERYDSSQSTPSYYLGHICSPATLLLVNGGENATWVDSNRFLLEEWEYTTPQGMKLHVGKIGQDIDTLEAVTDYDWTIIP